MSSSIKSFPLCFSTALFLLGLLALDNPAQADPIDTLQSEAAALKKSRDCEGAFKKYEELRNLLNAKPKTRQTRSLLAATQTQLSQLKGCYEKCLPSDAEKQSLEQAQDFETKGQVLRAHSILSSLLRGKNPRCTTWKAALEKRNALTERLPKRRKQQQQQVDPCAMQDDTRQSMQALQTEIRELEQKIATLQKPEELPNPPEPPKWAKTERQKYRWTQNWRKKELRKLRNTQGKRQGERLTQILASYRKINQLREKLFDLRENFQNCDEVYASLKKQSDSLRRTQDSAHQAVVGLYDSRIKSLQGSLGWYRRQYSKGKKNEATDSTTIASLQQSLQDQREMLDNVTQDLVTLSTLLVFKPQQGQEGSLLDNSIGSMNELMNNQGKLLETMRQKYPHYLQTGEGRAALQRHISTLERFEKVLERFQGQQGGKKSEEVEKTLQSVRSSILLFEKAEESLGKTPLAAGSTGSPNTALQATASGGSNAPASRSPWGWLLLLSGLLLGVGAFGYLLYEKRKRPYERFDG